MNMTRRMDKKPILSDLQHMECASMELRLMERIQPYCKKLAIALGFHGHGIEVMNQKSDPVFYLLTEWLREACGDPNKPKTWRTLIEALRQANMQEEVTILKTHFIFDSDTSSQPSTTEPTEQAPVDITLSTQPSTPPPPPPPPLPPPPSLSDEFPAKIRVDVAVVKGLQELEIFFYSMLVRVMRYLQLKCDLSEAQLFLDGVIDTEDFSSCDNFCKLIRLLQRDHIDIFNIYILQGLVACLEEDDLTKLVQGYEEKKDDFLKQTKVLSFQRAVVNRVKPFISKGRAVVTIKIPIKKVSNRTLKDIEELAMNGFDDCYKSFVCLHAEPGSIIISWIFPETLSGKLEQLARKNAAIFEEAGVEEVTVGGRRVYPVTQQEDLLTPSQGIPIAVKLVYTEFYHQLVEAVSDPHTCQSLTAQLRSTTWISQEKIAELSHGGITGSDLLNVLGVAKEPHLLTVLIEKMAGVKQLQRLAELMSARLCEVKQAGEADELMTVSDKQTSGQHTTADVIHASDVSLRASKKEQQLQSQLATVQQESQDKEQQLFKLKIENDDLLKKIGVFEYENGQHHKHLNKLQKDYEARLAASKEEQQRLLQGMEQHQRMSRARDTQISQLLNENEIMQNKCDALKASYQQSQKEKDQLLQTAADKIALLENRLAVRKVSTSPLSDQYQKGSLVREIVSEDIEMNFTYLLFYKPILDTTLKVEFVFVVTYNHELFVEIIRKEYCSYLEDGQYRMLKFDNDTIVLDLPAEGYPVKVADGWKILPLNRPQIARVDVQQFYPGRKVPACTIELEWIGSGEPKRLSHKVNIIGAKKPDNYFYIRYFPQNYTSTDSSSKKETTPTLLKLKTMQGKDGTPLRFIKTMAAGDYMTFGMCLLHDKNGDEVEMLENNYGHQGAEAITEAIIRKWLTSGGATWQHLIECLHQSGMGALAKLIAENYVQQQTSMPTYT